MITNIACYLGSNSGTNPEHQAQVKELALALAHQNYQIIYGGGAVGLMGILADTALTHHAKVHGVITSYLADKELSHYGLTKLDIVPDMPARKHRMFELADAFIILPGGVGTMEEFFEVWSWLNLGLHTKPVALYGKKFWQPMISLLDHLVKTGFLAPTMLETLIIADSPEELFAHFANFTAPVMNWQEKRQGKINNQDILNP